MNVSRYCNTKTVECSIEFLSPAFLGGANQSAELRAAPFKAALRWWWRVLYSGAMRADEVWEKECAIFGSTEHSAAVRAGVSGVIPAEDGDFPKGRKTQVTSKGKTFSINILDYLAYGTYDFSQSGPVYKRSHLQSGRPFSVSLEVNTNYAETVTHCLNALLAFGGVGSRCRNGFGSLASVKPLPPAVYAHDWKNARPVAWPTLNAASKLFVTQHDYGAWKEALSEIGVLYREARGNLERKHQFVKRGFIARPIEVKGEDVPGNIKNGRVPKQFILHVGRRNGGYFGQILSLPVLFCEKDKQKDYDAVIDAMHRFFAREMADKTAGIPEMMGVSA